MKIHIEQAEQTKFSEVKPGDLIRYNSSVWMKCDQPVGGPNAVNLYSGELVIITKNTEVLILKGTLEVRT